MGEDIGRVGGIFRATEGLYERYGAERIRDTPLTESGFVGCGVGAALTGLRPVVEIQFSDFVGVAFDQIMNQAAKLRFMMGGVPTLPLVLRMVSGGGVRLGAQHSQSLEALFGHIPGLVVIMPSNPFDAKGLLAAAIQDDNPVMFLEQKLLFFDEPTPVPEARYAIELGRARIAREGSDATVVALGATVPLALKAARELEREGVSVEVVDPANARPARHARRSPTSIAKTGRVAIVHEAVQFLGFGSEIAAHIAEHSFWDLDAPVVRVGAPSHPDSLPAGSRARDAPRRRRDRRRGAVARTTSGADDGVLGLVKTIALEGAEAGISASAVCPGYVRTPLVEGQIADQAKSARPPDGAGARGRDAGPHAVKRLLEPSEVADVVAFVLGPSGRAFTGSPVVIDLGWSAR